MQAFTDNQAAQRFEQGFAADDGAERLVFCDYAVQGEAYFLLHVEADPVLRGTGASGRFMQSLADHARAKGIKLTPRCSYAVLWFQRHRSEQDLLA